MDEWKTIPWRKLERKVFKLQKRIYQASSRGDAKTVRRLQRLMMSSWSAKTLAVRKVTQDNQGKKTAGVDGIKSLSPAARLDLVGQLKLTGKSKPIRRIWIPKPGKDELRPLGIPVMYDRALQALVKLGMEPDWESRFEPNSYGFRPGRSCHDAIEAIYNCIKQKPKWILDADISKCFDKINHQALLRKIHAYHPVKRQIKSWLKAGIMEGKDIFPNTEGTPQGGVISPLLANIALHGMETGIKELARTFDMRDLKGCQIGHSKKERSLGLVRYADDFVIMHENLEAILACRAWMENWLKDIGLELKPSKTRITHTLQETEYGKPGFNFLGFHIRQYPVGRGYSGKCNGKILGFKTLIKPSQEAQKRHYQILKAQIRNHRNSSQEALIAALNPIITGWSNYYRSSTAKRVFGKLDTLVFSALLAWGKYRHPKKGTWFVTHKYWKTIDKDRWVFATGHDNPLHLLKHSRTSITRHIKVKGTNSPYDGNLTYWSARLGRHPEMPTRTALLLKRQNGKCSHCGLFFKDREVMEIDHILPKALGGSNKIDNLQLLHRHCHDEKTRTDGSAGTQSQESGC